VESQVSKSARPFDKLKAGLEHPRLPCGSLCGVVQTSYRNVPSVPEFHREDDRKGAEVHPFSALDDFVTTRLTLCE
jgi:hypothetical protein